MNPFKDCRRIFFSAHFWLCKAQRSIAQEYVFEIIKSGTKERKSNSKYLIQLGGWTIVATKYVGV